MATDHRSLPRSKETVQELELLTVLKKTVKAIEDKEYLSEDIDFICEKNTKSS